MPAAYVVWLYMSRLLFVMVYTAAAPHDARVTGARRRRKETEMKIEVRFRALDASEPVREHLLRAVHFHLSRFGRELSSVSARIGDVNGPRRGIDKRCQLHVRGPRIGSIVVAEVNADAYAAVDGCADRAGRSVGRELERRRTHDSRPQQSAAVNGEPSI
jgi:putative sigma-54 modulation protein